MVSILTSSLGNSYKVNGKRVPTYLPNENGLADSIKKFWKNNSKVIILSASPAEFEKNDSILFCQKEAFAMSGLEVSSFEICDFRNEWIADKIEEYDVIILSGGHVPTENKFFEKIKLKQKLQKFDGMVIAWSAGSMNCADVVYAVPEIDGEAIDKNYERFIPGLGITKKMIIPHFQAVSGETVDGLRVVEDMVYPDSMGKRIYSLN